MIKQIGVFSRKNIESCLKNKQQPIKTDNEWAIISIYGVYPVINSAADIETLKFLKCNEYMTILFSDLTKKQLDEGVYVLKIDDHLFDSNDAERIINFIDKVNENKNVDTLIVQCNAGICRSGAIGLFACRYLKLNENKFRKMNRGIQPNPWVLEVLLKKSGFYTGYEDFWKEMIENHNQVHIDPISFFRKSKIV